MAFQKGVSGNPAGRKPGIIDKRQRIAQFFETDGAVIAQVVIDAAKKGDIRAAELVLSRVSPPVKARAERVQFSLDVAAPLAAQAAQVVTAIAAGQLDPESARVVLDCLCQYVTLVQADELEGRIARLEGVGGAHRTMGGVMEMKQ
jgi:hypothetical protein